MKTKTINALCRTCKSTCKNNFMYNDPQRIPITCYFRKTIEGKPKLVSCPNP